MINGIEKLKQIQELKELDAIQELDKWSHEFQGKDYIWNQTHRLRRILLHHLDDVIIKKIEETNKGTDSSNVNKDDAKKQYLDVWDKDFLPFLKCIINKEIDNLKDDLRNVLDPEQFKNLTKVQKELNFLADYFNDEENEPNHRDLIRQANKNQHKLGRMEEPLCLKIKKAKSKLDKKKIREGRKHIIELIHDITFYYGMFGKNIAYKQGDDINWSYALHGSKPCCY